jgi:hypothetical protein
MLRIGKGAQSFGAVQPGHTQISLGDLFHIYTQASRSVGQPSQFCWHVLASEYTLTVTADIKQGSIWQLSVRQKGTASNTLWTMRTNQIPDVHKRILEDAK